MEDNRPTLAQYFVAQACPDNKFLEEMNNVIPWWEIESWFKGHLKKERKKAGRPSYPIILMFKIHLIQDLTFLTKLAEQYGYIFKIAENNLVFYNVRQLKDTKAIQILYKTDFSMLSFREKNKPKI